MLRHQRLVNIKKSNFIFLFTVAFFIISLFTAGIASQETPDDTETKLLILDNCDSNNTSTQPPFGDSISLLNSSGRLIKKIDGLYIHVTFGGNRAISVSEDGGFFVVCENAADMLRAYKTDTGRELWSLTGMFESVVVSKDIVYALNYKNVYAIDNTGTIIKHCRVGGIDIVVDSNHDCLWIVGLDIKKLSLDLEVLLSVDPIKETQSGAFSVDFGADGSIWLAERDIQGDNKNRLIRISQDGTILKTIELEFSPYCVRVDRVDGSVWTTGIGKQNYEKLGAYNDWPENLSDLRKIIESRHTQKYDSDGRFLFGLDLGGNSLDISPLDNSVWIAGKTKVLHYSKTGNYLDEYQDVSDDQKWVAVIQPQSIGK